MDSVHFNSVFKLLLSGTDYILYDRVGTNKVLLFDSVGNFKKLICKNGDGINEPLNMSNIWLNKNNLEVYDFAQMKIIRFDSNYNYYSSVIAKALNHFSDICPIANTANYIAYANFNDYPPLIEDQYFHLAVLDSNLNITKSYLPFEKKHIGVQWLMYNQHFFLNPDILFVKAYDNNIYEINQDSVLVRYHVKYLKNDMQEHDVMDIVDQNLDKFKDRTFSPNKRSILLKKFNYLSSPFFETDKLIILNSVDTTRRFGAIYITFYKKATKETQSFYRMLESQKYNMEIPRFEYYNPATKEYMTVLPGIELQTLIKKNSVFKDVIKNNDPYKFYIIKTKLKIND